MSLWEANLGAGGILLNLAIRANFATNGANTDSKSTSTHNVPVKKKDIWFMLLAVLTFVKSKNDKWNRCNDTQTKGNLHPGDCTSFSRHLSLDLLVDVRFLKQSNNRWIRFSTRPAESAGTIYVCTFSEVPPLLQVPADATACMWDSSFRSDQGTFYWNLATKVWVSLFWPWLTLSFWYAPGTTLMRTWSPACRKLLTAFMCVTHSKFIPFTCKDSQLMYFAFDWRSKQVFFVCFPYFVIFHLPIHSQSQHVRVVACVATYSTKNARQFVHVPQRFCHLLAVSCLWRQHHVREFWQQKFRCHQGSVDCLLHPLCWSQVLHKENKTDDRFLLFAQVSLHLHVWFQLHVGPEYERTREGQMWEYVFKGTLARVKSTASLSSHRTRLECGLWVGLSKDIPELSRKWNSMPNTGECCDKRREPTYSCIGWFRRPVTSQSSEGACFGFLLWPWQFVAL